MEHLTSKDFVFAASRLRGFVPGQHAALALTVLVRLHRCNALPLRQRSWYLCRVVEGERFDRKAHVNLMLAPQTEPLAALFELRAPELVQDVVSSARRSLAQIDVLQDGVERAGQVLATDAGPLAFEFATAKVGLVSGFSTQIRLLLYGASFLLDGIASLSHNRWSFSCERVFSLDRRAAERLPLSDSTAQLRWRVDVDGMEKTAGAPIQDLGHQGVGIVLARETGPLPEGESFSATLRINGHAIECVAEARHAQRLPGKTRYGIRLKALLDRDGCLDAYLAQRFPQLVDRRTLDPEQVHELLQTSGYLALREGVAPSRHWLARQDDTAISRDVCFRDRADRLIGHVSFTRAYGKAWLGHQLATIRPHEEAIACREAIYLHIATYPTLVDGDDAMMVGYFDRNRPWHQRFFSGFARWVDSPQLAVTIGLDRFERRAHERVPVAMAPHVSVSVASPEDLAGTTQLVRSHLPPLIADALDIRPQCLTATALHPRYVGTGYHRGRVALVLRVNGGLAGVALCETGSRELSIFNLFNMAQVFLRTGAEAPGDDAQLALLSAVREFYAGRGITDPILVAPPGTLKAELEPGTFLAETMGMIAWSGRGLRQYENFIRYEFGKERSNDKGVKYATVRRQTI